MNRRTTLSLLAAVLLLGCNTFGAPEEFKGSDTGGIADAGGAADASDTDSGMAVVPTLAPEELCPEAPRQTALPTGEFLTGNPVSNVSAAWTGRANASTVSVGFVTDDAAATVAFINIPDSGNANSVASTFTIRSGWALPGHESLDVDVIPALVAEDGPRLLSVSDPCETEANYGIEGEVGGSQEEIPVACTTPVLPIAAEYVGGVSEFNSANESLLSVVTAEVVDQQVFLALRGSDDEPIRTDILPSAPLTADEFDLRGTTGELALAFNANAEAFVLFTPDGVLTALEDQEGNPLTRRAIELDIVHLDDNRYAVAFTDGQEVVLARYDLELVDSAMGPPFRFESVGIVERIPLDGPSIGVALAAFRNGVALLYFEEEATDQEWTIRPYKITDETFTPYGCDSDFSYRPIEMHSVDVIARRVGRDLVVQQANHFTVSPPTSQVNVEGFVYPNFF